MQHAGIDYTALLNKQSITLMTAELPDKRRARTERTRQKLLDAAMACYKVKGVNGTGMDEVALQAGVGRATLYRHFSNHESLLSEVMANNLRQIQVVIASSMQSCDTTADLYVEAALIILQESQDRGLTALFFGEDSSSPVVNRISFTDPAIMRMGEDLLDPFFKRARREGILRHWVTRPLLLEWTSRVMLSFIMTPSPRINSPGKLRRFFHQAIIPSIIEPP
jgi:AcrR family transcriptional regulator